MKHSLRDQYWKIQRHSRSLRQNGSLDFFTGDRIAEEFSRAVAKAKNKDDDAAVQPHLATDWEKRAAEFCDVEIPRGSCH